MTEPSGSAAVPITSTCTGASAIRRSLVASWSASEAVITPASRSCWIARCDSGRAGPPVAAGGGGVGAPAGGPCVPPGTCPGGALTGCAVAAASTLGPGWAAGCSVPAAVPPAEPSWGRPGSARDPPARPGRPTAPRQTRRPGGTGRGRAAAYAWAGVNRPPKYGTSPVRPWICSCRGTSRMAVPLVGASLVGPRPLATTCAEPTTIMGAAARTVARSDHARRSVSRRAAPAATPGRAGRARASRHRVGPARTASDLGQDVPMDLSRREPSTPEGTPDDEITIEPDLVRTLLRRQVPQWADLPAHPDPALGHRPRDAPAGRRPGGPAAAGGLGGAHPGGGAELAAADRPTPARRDSRSGRDRAPVGRLPVAVDRVPMGAGDQPGRRRPGRSGQAWPATSLPSSWRCGPSTPREHLPRSGRPRCTRRTTASARHLPELDGIGGPAAVAARLGAGDARVSPATGRTWIHGDLAAGNLLLRDGRLRGVIDFSAMGLGDPASDLRPAGTCSRRGARPVLRDAVGADDANGPAPAAGRCCRRWPSWPGSASATRGWPPPPAACWTRSPTEVRSGRTIDRERTSSEAGSSSGSRFAHRVLELRARSRRATSGMLSTLPALQAPAKSESGSMKIARSSLTESSEASSLSAVVCSRREADGQDDRDVGVQGADVLRGDAGEEARRRAAPGPAGSARSRGRRACRSGRRRPGRRRRPRRTWSRTTIGLARELRVGRLRRRRSARSTSADRRLTLGGLAQRGGDRLHLHVPGGGEVRRARSARRPSGAMDCQPVVDGLVGGRPDVEDQVGARPWICS